MSLQFVFGNAGSGKSYTMYQRFIKEAAESEKRTFLIVVPEQFTMQTQRELVFLQPEHTIMNIDVLSFGRLAYRVFDELGENMLTVLEETGKNYILKKIIRKQADHLKFMASKMNKPGYINELKSVLSEFMQYRILPEQLENTLSDSAPDVFSMKLKDIAVLYRAYLEELNGSYMTTEEVLIKLADVVGRSRLVKGSTLLLDGFTGFTPVQLEALEAILPLCEKVYVNLTIDSREDAWISGGMQELFYLTKKTVRQLCFLAKNCGCGLEEPIIFDSGDTMRYAQAKDLYWLEQNLFRLSAAPYPKQAQNIVVAKLADPIAELQYAAYTIQNLVREEHYRYRDFAVVFADMETYGKYGEGVFETYGVPVFTDRTQTLSEQPFVEVVRSILEVVEHDFSYESVIRYLKAGFSGYSAEQADLLENYILATGIRGFYKWNRKWVRRIKGMTEDELSCLEELRKRFLAEFEPLVQVFAKKDGTVRNQMRTLYEFFTAHRMEEQLKCREEAFLEIKEVSLAKEYASVYKTVIDLMDKMVALLGEEHFTVEECREMLEAGFESAKVGIIPPGNDCVQMGDIERSRLTSVKVLFLAGMNDGLVPKMTTRGGIISDTDRERLQKMDFTLAPGAREKAFIQRFYLYLMMTKPSGRLYLTYAKNGCDGQALRKSYLIGNIFKLFPSLKLTEERKIPLLEKIVTPNSAKRYLIRGMKAAGEERTEREIPSLYQWYQESEQWNKRLSLWEKGIFYRLSHLPLSGGLARELYGEMVQMSVTRLERFAACAFSHFLTYGLRLKERQIYEFAALDFGNVLHEALEFYAKRLEKAGVSWGDVREDVKERLITESFRDALLNVRNDILSDSARAAYMQERMFRIFKRTVWAIGHQAKEQGYLPEGYEVRFSGTEALESTKLELGENGRIGLNGKIDRIDLKTVEDRIHVQVVDYKTGNAKLNLDEVYAGLQLQLLVYMEVAMEIVQKQHPEKTAVPGGAYYYHVDDPLVSAEKPLSAEEADRLRLKQLEMKGIALEGEDYQTLAAEVREKTKELGEGILSGETATEPYRFGTDTGCDYCPYHAVCGFDVRLDGCSYREIKRGSKE